MIYNNSTAIQNTPEQYIPLPLDTLFQAGQALQARGDKNQEINDQFQSGLASLEALAPAQKAYIQNYVSKFRDDQNKLLDRFNGNTSDIDYGRESRRLISKYASDPNLKIIHETNALYKQKQQLANQLQANGKKYIDTNPTFRGVDENGNLVSNVGSVRATDFDESLTKQFQTIGDQTEQVGDTKTSLRNIQRRQAQLLGAIQGKAYDADIQDGIDYYKQQGMSDAQARAAMAQVVQSGNSYIKSDRDKDHFYEQMAWEKYKFNAQQAGQRQGPAGLDFEPQHYPGAIVDNTGITTPTRKLVESALKNLDGVNLKKDVREIDDTPENRAAFPNAKPSTKILGAGPTGGTGYTVKSLQVEGINANEANALTYARNLLGIKGGTAKAVLSKLSDSMKAFDSAANEVVSTDNTKINKALAENAIRQAMGGELYVRKNGKLQKVDASDPDVAKELSQVNQSDVQGISSRTIHSGDIVLNGYTQFNDKAGNTYYTPLSKEYNRKFIGSKLTENYLQNFEPASNVEFKAGNQKIFIDPNTQDIPYSIPTGNGVVQGALRPYKAYDKTSGKIIGGGLFRYVDPSTGQEATHLIPLSALENNEFNSIGVNISNHNKITGNE